MVFEQLIYEKVFLQLRSHNSENGWTTGKSRLLKYLLQQNLSQQKKQQTLFLKVTKSTKTFKKILSFCKN